MSNFNSFKPKNSYSSQNPISRRDFLKLCRTVSFGYFLTACGINQTLESPVTSTLSPTKAPTITIAPTKIPVPTPTPEPIVLQEWPNARIIWEMKPEQGFSNFSAWETGYPDDSFPGIMEIKDDPTGLWGHKVFWSHIPGDLVVEDWERLRLELRKRNIVLNDWVGLAEHSRDPEHLEEFFRKYVNDIVDVSADIDATIVKMMDIASKHKLRVYPQPMRDFPQPIELPVRINMEFTLGDDFVRADKRPVEIGWHSGINLLSVFDTYYPDYYPNALVNLEGPLDDLHIQALSSGDPRPGRDIQGSDDYLVLTKEGKKRRIKPGNKYGLMVELTSKREFLVYIQDSDYGEDYVVYATGKFSDAAYPEVVSTHSGLYHWWERPEDKLISGTFVLGRYEVSNLG